MSGTGTMLGGSGALEEATVTVSHSVTGKAGLACIPAARYSHFPDYRMGP